MGKEDLDRLVGIGQLKVTPPRRAEFLGMISGAQKRLADAQNEDLTSESRFDLAYGAAHAYALAALRLKGYRSENRITVFNALVHTIEGLNRVALQIFSKCHNERNLMEYEGRTEIDERLLADLIRHTIELEKAMLALTPPAK
jgi:hypothetical protein